MKPVCLNLSECPALGDLICATPTIRKLSESYERKITVVSPIPELFKNLEYVEASYKVTSLDMGYFNEHYIMHNSFYNVGKKNERGVEYKHNMIDIRQFHAIHLGFMLGKDEMECYYRPLEDLKIAWNFYIGGYQPAQKYLKDRRGKKLTNDEIEQYQKIIKVLVETDKLMKEIKL